MFQNQEKYWQKTSGQNVPLEVVPGPLSLALLAEELLVSSMSSHL